MSWVLRRVIVPVGLAFLLGSLSSTYAIAADKSDQKAKSQTKSRKASRNLDSKLVDEDTLDVLTASGESNSVPCETCDPEDPIIQEKVGVPVPGSSGTSSAFLAQEEARAAGQRMPAMTNPNINFFQSLR